MQQAEAVSSSVMLMLTCKVLLLSGQPEQVTWKAGVGGGGEGALQGFFFYSPNMQTEEVLLSWCLFIQMGSIWRQKSREKHLCSSHLFTFPNSEQCQNNYREQLERRGYNQINWEGKGLGGTFEFILTPQRKAQRISFPLNTTPPYTTMSIFMRQLICWI